MKVTKEQLLNVWGVLEAVSKQKAPVRFAYGIAKNMRLLKDEVGAIQEARMPPEKFQEFERKRIKICRDLADKDDNGQPVVLGIQFKVTENEAELNEKIDALREEYKEAIEEFNEREKEVVKLLKEEVEFDVYKVDFSEFPEKMSAEQMEVLLDFVNEDEEQDK